MSDSGTRRLHAGRKQISLAVIRILGAMSALLLAYFMFPMTDRDNVAIGLVAVVAGLAVFGVIFYRQLHKIRRADYPFLRAGEAVMLIATTFIVIMATIASIFANADASNYSEPLSRLDALYFTVTTLATVGFGDITPTAPATRAFTTLQILLGVALLGVGVRALITVAQEVDEGRLDQR
ncbi:MAG: potassium channel family protein [Actinomycetes bacterium]